MADCRDPSARKSADLRVTIFGCCAFLANAYLSGRLRFPFRGGKIGNVIAEGVVFNGCSCAVP